MNRAHQAAVENAIEVRTGGTAIGACSRGMCGSSFYFPQKPGERSSMKSILVAMMLVLPLSAFANEYDREYVEGRDASICDAYANAAAVAVIENGLKTQNITVNAGDVTASKPATGAYTEYPVGSTLGDYYGAHLQVKFGGEYVADVSVMLAYVQNSKDCYATEITPFWKKK